MYKETELSDFLIHPNTLTQDTIDKITQLRDQNPWCELYQYLFLKNIYNIQPSEFETELHKSIPFISDRKALFNFIYCEKAENKVHPTELIDRFLTNQPKINVRRDPSTVPDIDLSESATIENDTVISETLAKIYVKQQNFQRAIKIYEQLSLKNPEKSSYFANQINLIEEKIKNK